MNHLKPNHLLALIFFIGGILAMGLSFAFAQATHSSPANSMLEIISAMFAIAFLAGSIASFIGSVVAFLDD